MATRTRLLPLLVLFLAGIASAVERPVGHPTFLSPHANPIVLADNRVYVTNTAADTVDVLDVATRAVIARIPVGIDPVGLALRPDGRELWVSNHVSDSVNVIDLDPSSPTHLRIIGTVQDFDPITRATRFDEPVGIAFASNDKAYVALSTENEVAVVDVATRTVTNRLRIPAQDPRALAVRNGRLYVIPFESHNQTQISGCVGAPRGNLCTFDAQQHVVDTNNVLSRGIIVDVIRDIRIPDRDLFVFDTTTDRLIDEMNGLGTLLYGVAVSSEGKVFVTQADARNDANGRAGTMGDGLAEMQHRAFLNRITQLDCNGSCGAPDFIDLEPLPPNDPAPGRALATPYALALTPDERTLVATAAGSNIVFTVDAANGAILGRVPVGAIPRGVAISGDGRNAWIYNDGDASVSLLDLSNRANPRIIGTTSLDDPTPPVIKRGRLAFSDANASTNGTYSCESCHPDGNTDQLVWILDTPPCNVPGCDQIPPRITMPVRGLRDTAPFHWDGIPGDPYGGRNTANITGNVPPNCDLDDPASCTRDLVDGSLASTMCSPESCPTNDEGKGGALDAARRDDLAEFLLDVSYPPAQRRAWDNELTQRAHDGFRLFHIDGDLQPDGVNVCGDCHRMPFWVTTNSLGTGMEAPTWRGAWDRWLILPQGRLNIIDFPFFANIARLGTPEELVWRLSWASRGRFNPVWNMVTEGSTGYSGSFGRQLTLDAVSANDDETGTLLSALERAGTDGEILLHVDGAFLDGEPVALYFDRGVYRARGDGDGDSYTGAELVQAAADGLLIATFTARSGANIGLEHPQPALWTLSSLHLPEGRQRFPVLGADQTTLDISGRHVEPGAHVLVNGRRVTANVRCQSGKLPACDGELLQVQLAERPAETGMHFLQIQNRDGLISNDFIFHTTAAGEKATFDVSGPWYREDQAGHGWLLEQLEPAEPGGNDRLIAYWYVYRDGEPVWLIGQGEIVDGRAELDTFVTNGGEFPPDYDAEAVELIPWGTLSLEFADDTFASVSWYSIVDGFGASSLNVRRLGDISPLGTACRSGSFIAADQPGHGFVSQVLEIEGETQVLLSWYVYQGGRQVWLLGQAPLEGSTASIPMRRYAGSGFPPDFASGEVTSTDWGTLDLRFAGPDGAVVSWDAREEGYADGSLDLVRLTSLKGRACR